MKKSLNNTDKSNWQLSAPRTLVTTPVMTLTTSRVRSLSKGTEKDFFKLDCQPWVNIVACTENRELVLIRQYRFGTDRIELEIPGGAVDPGEPPLAAGLRELLEETGYAGDHARIIGQVCPNPAIQGNTCSTVLVENARQVAEPRLDEMEDIEVLLVPEDEVFALVRAGSLSHGLVLNGLMFYALAGRKTMW